MFPITRVRILSHEVGFHFVDGEFVGLLRAGLHWWVDPLGRHQVDVSSTRGPWIVHPQLDVIVRSGVLDDKALVLDLKDHERALVWVDGRFDCVADAGLHALWTNVRDVRAEVVDARGFRFEHADRQAILASPSASEHLEVATIPEEAAGVLFREGRYVETLGPGTHAFWRGFDGLRVVTLSLREEAAEVNGQDIMTGDKVTLRINATLFLRVVDPARAVTVTADARQQLYREAQLALRAVVGTRDLDALLADKDAVARELTACLVERGRALGLEVRALGIRDVILPGEMKDLLNKVTEARKAAEANVIVRREETAAMRSQVNTAKLFENNPALMRLKELEVLEKVAGNAKLNVVLGEKGLAERIVNLI